MVTDGYKKYISGPRWAAKRQQAFAYHGKRCFACLKAPRVLHVHHLTYVRLGREDMSDLMILCVECHREITKIYKSNRRRGLRRVSLEYAAIKRRGLKNRRGTSP